MLRINQPFNKSMEVALKSVYSLGYCPNLNVYNQWFSSPLILGIGSNWVAGKVYEGDAEQMYEIISAKFKELSEEYMTTQEEGDAIVSKMQKELSSSKLKDMYASDDREKFASELMIPMFEEQLANREKISTPTEDEIRYAMIDDMQGIIFIH